MYELLSRDYLKEPLKKYKVNGVGQLKYEIPSKKDIELLYNYYNLNTNQLKEYFNISNGRLSKIIKDYGIKKDKNKKVSKILKTKLERYGDKNYNNRDKFKKTNLERYGVSNYTKTKEYKEKTKNTCLERYGVEHYNNSNKAKNTCLERYGVEHYNKSELSKIRHINSCLERYGISFKNQYEMNEKYKLLLNEQELIKYIKNNNIISGSELSKKIGISPSCCCKYIRKYNLENLMDYSSSVEEKEIRDYVNQYYKTENNTRKYLNGKEIDIYIPELKIGIEFNGNFWHNENILDKLYHQQKSFLAESKGIFLYHIFEYEWKNNKNKILNQLNNLLSINKNKIYARNCIIKEVDNKEKSNFLELNHMQGNDASSIKLGLYYDNKLVSLMTFVKPRFNKKYEYELSRFCSKSGCNVVGGASKLFKYFIKKYNPTSIISYSNIAHTKGNLYGLLGFKLNNISLPNYVWCKCFDTLSRYQCQKHKLLKQGYIGNSENDIMINRGYYKIYDCGNKVWIWNNK